MIRKLIAQIYVEVSDKQGGDERTLIRVVWYIISLIVSAAQLKLPSGKINLAAEGEKLAKRAGVQLAFGGIPLKVYRRLLRKILGEKMAY